MQEIKYNPFGDTESTYYPDHGKYRVQYRSTSTETWKKWLLGSLAVILALAVVMFASNFIMVRNKHSDAIESMEEFNEGTSAVHTVFISGQLRTEYAELSRNDSIDPEIRNVFKASVDMITRLPDHPPTIDENSDPSQFAMRIAPYFALCDIIAQVPPKSTEEPSLACSDYDATAREMMKNISLYNVMASSWQGVLAFKSDTLPDITAKTNGDIPTQTDQPQPSAEQDSEESSNEEEVVVTETETQDSEEPTVTVTESQ